MVCLQCFDDDGIDIAQIDDGVCKPRDSRGYHALQKRRDIHDRLIMTNGGKGLRMEGIVSGRKILSRIDLDTIDTVRVQRHTNKQSEKGAELSHNHVRSEYWLSQYDPMVSSKNRDTIEAALNPVSELNQCWNQVNDDQLYIHSTQGTLFLRFIADLDAVEGTKDPAKLLNYNSIALQWCKSITLVKQKQITHGNPTSPVMQNDM